MERTRPRSPAGQLWTSGTLTDMASAWGDLASEMAGAFDTFIDTMAAETGFSPQPRTRRRDRPGRKRERCGSCRRDTCHCDCCVYDADLVVYARLGEQRVVPIRVSNERSRTRHITLELSEFSTSGGNDAPVRGLIATSETFDLEACAHEDVVLVIVAAPGRKEVPKGEAVEELSGKRFAEDLSAEKRDPDRITDVDDCLVAYADLRIQGCDVRPVRIAVALVPRDCDAYNVHCACGCC